MRMCFQSALRPLLWIVLGATICQAASGQKILILQPRENIEEIIFANLKDQAPKYGFRLVFSRKEADFILEGAAAAFERTGGFLDGYPCNSVYFFDVYRAESGKRRKVGRFEGPNEETPCIRLVIAKQILAKLRTIVSWLPAPQDPKKKGTGK